MSCCRLRVPIRRVATVAVLLSVALGCTPRPPELLRVEAEVRVVTDRLIDREYEQLSLFVEATDPDGFDDLDELLLLHDPSELYWSIERISWVATRGGSWIGSAALTMADLGPMPRGVYRLLLYDSGGNRVEQQLSIRSGSQPVERPDIRLNDEGVQLISPSSVVVQLVDPQGRTVSQKRIGPGLHPWERLTDGAEIPIDLSVYVRVESDPGEGLLPRLIGPFFP